VVGTDSSADLGAVQAALPDAADRSRAEADAGGSEPYLVQQQPRVADDRPQRLDARPDEVSPDLLHNLPKMLLQQEGTQLDFRLSHLDGGSERPAVLGGRALGLLGGGRDGGGAVLLPSGETQLCPVPKWAQGGRASARRCSGDGRDTAGPRELSRGVAAMSKGSPGPRPPGGWRPCQRGSTPRGMAPSPDAWGPVGGVGGSATPPGGWRPCQRGPRVVSPPPGSAAMSELFLGPLPGDGGHVRGVAVPRVPLPGAIPSTHPRPGVLSEGSGPKCPSRSGPARLPLT